MSALPAGQPILDPHHHLWQHPSEPYMIEQLRADTDSVPGVVGTVFLECGSGYREDGPEAFRPVGETEFVVAADPDAFILGIVGFADLTVPEIDDVLAAHVEAGDGRFRGVRHVTAWDASPDVRRSHTDPSPGLMGEPAFRRGIAALGRAGLSFDAWLYHPQLPELAALARDHEGVTVVLDHLGGPLGIGPYAGRRDEVLAEWRSSMEAVAACPNVVLKLGGIGMSVYGMGWHRRDEGRATPDELVTAWGAEIRWCIERFGPDRCMFESNFPVDKVSCTFADLWEAFGRITAAAGAGPADTAALFHDTAVRTYRL
jgi:L-fuconolactonase